ncbi:MAG: sterol desaturase family protein [Pseudomonadota bacterium]
MGTLNAISELLLQSIWIKVIVIPLTFIAICILLFGRRDELSGNAARNTLATLFLVLLNYGTAILFAAQIAAAVQSFYDALGIPHLDPAFWDGVPLLATILIGLIVRDFADYACHRWMHTSLGWPTHAAHHSDSHVNAFTVYRIHFLEALVITTTNILLLTWLQIPEAIPFVLLLTILYGHYVHTDLPFTHGKLWWLFASPVFHRWHHADVPEAYGKNLSNIFSIWDVIFGTYYRAGPCKAEMGGRLSGLSDTNPLRIFIYPFQEWARIARAALGRTTRRKAPAPDLRAKVSKP